MALTETSDSRSRCLLIVPDGGINPKMGSGQRSGICFEALKQIGPVDVAILGEGTDPLVAAFFPGAASVRWVNSARFPVTRKTGFAWLVYNLQRFAFVARLYAPEPQVQRQLSELIEDTHRVVLCRYALPFCVSGVVSDGPRHVFVDIDDRDDQKFLTAAYAVLGQGALGGLFRRLVVPAVRRQLVKHLRAARLLWYATPEDDLHIPGPKTAILRNVPFGVSVPQDAPAPSASHEVLFVGSYAHRPNQDGMRWFLKHCWPELSRRHPEARLRVVGLGPWADMAPDFPDLERVDYVGTVEDVAAEYLRARVVISPIFDGGGSKIKVIEACAYGRPVVVAPHSARGFGTALDTALPQGGSPQAFLDACDQLLANDAEADALGVQLQELQEAEFSQSAAEARIVADITPFLDPA
jgi:glycosyltransferase involved in cell wall biosynthesis